MQSLYFKNITSSPPPARRFNDGPLEMYAPYLYAYARGGLIPVGYRPTFMILLGFFWES